MVSSWYLFLCIFLPEAVRMCEQLTSAHSKVKETLEKMVLKEAGEKGSSLQKC